MKKLFKSYLKLFFRKWLETLVILVLLITFLGTVIGFVSTPLQLQTKIDVVLKKSNVPDIYLKYNKINFSKNFIEEYFLNDPDKEYATFPNGIETFKIDRPMVASKDGKNKELIPLLNEDKINEFFKGSSLSPDEIRDKKINIISRSLSQLSAYPVLIEDDKGQSSNPNSYYKNPDYFLSDKLTKFACDLEDSISLKTFFLSSMIQSFNNPFTSQFPGVNLFDELTLYGRVFLNNENVNISMTDAKSWSFFSDSDPMKMVILSGHAPNAGEIVVAPIFYKNYGLHLNQIVNIDGKPLTIVGTAVKYDKLFAGGSIGDVNRLVSQEIFLNSEDINVFYHSNSFQDSYSRVYRVYASQKNSNISKFVNSIMTINADNVDPSSLPSEEYTGISIITILCILFIILGIFIMILSIYFILFYLQRDIKNSRPQLGILKAMGYKKSELTWIFVFKTYILILLAVLFGYALSIGLQLFVAPLYVGVTRLTYEIIYHNWLFLMVLIIGVPILFSLLSYFVLLRNFHDSALSLMNEKSKVSKNNIFITILKYIFFPVILIGMVQKSINTRLARRKIGFSWRMRYLISSRDITKFVTVMALIGLTSFALIAQFNLKKLMNDDSNSKFISYKSNVDIRYKINQLTTLDVNNHNKFYFHVADKGKGYRPNDLHFVNTDQEIVDRYEEYQIQNQVLNTSTDVISKTIDAFSNQKRPSNASITPTMAAWITEMFVPYNDDYLENIKEAAKSYFGFPNNKSKFEDIIGAWIKDGKPNLLSITAKVSDNDPANDSKYQLNAFKSSDMVKYLGEMLNINDDVLPNLNNRGVWPQTFGISDTKVSKENDQQLVKYNSVNGVLELVAMLVNSISDNYDPYIIPNTLFYSQSQDFLFYEQDLRVKDDTSTGIVKFNIYDSSGTYGSPKNVLHWTGSAVGSEQNLQKNDDDDGDDPRAINAIISKLLAKKLNVGVGNIVTFEKISNGASIPIYIKIIGVNNSDVSNSNVYVDLKTFANNYIDYGPPVVLNNDKYSPIWNQLFAKRNNFVGKINANDLDKMARSIKFTEPSININMDNCASLFETITNLDQIFSDNANNPLIGYIKEKIKLNTSKNYTVLNSFLFNDIGSKWDNFPIEKAVVLGKLSFFEQVMTIFMVLNIILMIVLLFMTVNSIVDDLYSIILMLKSFGYKTSQITWMIFGNYAIWSAILFVVSFLFAQALDYFLKIMIWSRSNVILNVTWGYEAPLISLLIIVSIIGIGFATSLYRILKLKTIWITD